MKLKLLLIVLIFLFVSTISFADITYRNSSGAKIQIVLKSGKTLTMEKDAKVTLKEADITTQIQNLVESRKLVVVSTK